MPIRKLPTFIIILLNLNSAFLFSQAELDIKPNRVEFEDEFNRIKTAYLINKGNEILTIDSINFNPEFYLIDFENNLQLPFTIPAVDSIKMHISLTGYFYITVSDTIDTLLIYNDGINSPGRLRARVDFFENEFGSVSGTVTDGNNPVENALVYFFYDGVYLLDTAATDIYGEYNISLPSGDYTICAKKNGYHLSYYNNTFDPFFAEEVFVGEEQSRQINMSLKAIIDTSRSIRGKVSDSPGNRHYRGIVIIRKGKHVPINRPQSVFANTSLVYAGLVNQDGSYKVYMDSADYYYVQAYTNYFLPGYYTDTGVPSVFWNQGDSVLIDNTVLNKNITLTRDSSYGGGIVSGNIIFLNPEPDFDYEGITLISRSIYNGRLCSYNFSKQNGTYSVANIPYGKYEIVAQKIGYENSVSQVITIDSAHTSYTGIDLVFSVTGVNDNPSIPREIELYPNYPNPFNPVTNISFNLPEAADVKLKVLNILGETVEVLLDSYLHGGRYNYNFVADDLSSGIYIVTLQAGNKLKTQKIVLLK